MAYVINTAAQKFGVEFAEEIADWMNDNLDPDDVFDDEHLKNWALDQKPDDVCNQRALETWAEDNGYVHESEIEVKVNYRDEI